MMSKIARTGATVRERDIGPESSTGPSSTLDLAFVGTPADEGVVYAAVESIVAGRVVIVAFEDDEQELSCLLTRARRNEAIQHDEPGTGL